MRASGAMQDRVAASDAVTVHYNTQIRDVFGDAKGVKGLHLVDTQSGVALTSLHLA